MLPESSPANGIENTRRAFSRAFPALVLLGLGIILLGWTDRQSFASWSGLRFLVGALLFLYVPGVLVLGGLGRPRSSIAFALCTGLPCGLVAYWVLGSHLPRFGYTIVSTLVGASVLVWRREWLVPSLPRPRFPLLLGVLVIGGFSVWSLSQTTYRGAQRTEEGLSYLHAQVYRDTKVGGSDALFHAAVTGALARSPAEEPNPFVSGEPLAYHYGMDLLAAPFARELGIHPLDLAGCLFPTLFLLLLCALVYAAARALRLEPGTSLVATLLIFGTDFGILLYLFPVRPEWPEEFWLAHFTSYPFTSFFWVNPHLPALVVFAGGLLAMATGMDSRRGRLLVSLLFGATALFKVYLAFHVAMVLSVAAAWSFIKNRDRRWLEVTAATGIGMLGIALAHGFYGSSQVESRFDYLPTVMGSFRASGLSALSEVLERARFEPGIFTILPAVMVLGFYLFMVLGVRVAAVPLSLSWLRHPGVEPARRFLALFFLLGLVPPLFFVVAASRLNSTYFFFNQSLFAGAIVLAAAIGGITAARWRVAAFALAVVLALAPTVRNLDFWSDLPAAHWSASELSAALHLRETAGPDDVVLHAVLPDTPSPASHIGGLSSVLTYWQGYPYSFAAPEEVDRRLFDLTLFFRTEEQSTARNIVEGYGVTWVYSLKKSHPLRFPCEGFLEKSYENEEVILYRVK